MLPILPALATRSCDTNMGTLQAPAEAEAPQAEVESVDGCGCGAADENDTQARVSATETSGPAAGCAGPMAELFTGGSAGEKAGIAAAMANCRP